MGRVLIVDDDAGIRHVLRSTLEECGYVVSEASDGLRALEQLRVSRWPLVVLLDLKLPNLSGAGVLGAVAGDRALVQRHRYVLVTANAATLPLALGSLLVSLQVPIVQKPIDCEALLDQVAQLSDELAAVEHVGNGARKSAMPTGR